jgi:hypothetical protein
MNSNNHSRCCHPERVSRSPERSEGEGSISPGTEILSAAKDDRHDLHTFENKEGMCA